MRVARDASSAVLLSRPRGRQRRRGAAPRAQCVSLSQCSSSTAALLVCALCAEADHHLGRDSCALLELRTQGRVASREAAAEWRARAHCACSLTPNAPALPERLWAVVCVCMSCRSSGEPVAPRFRVGYVLRCPYTPSEPSSSVRDACGGPLQTRFPQKHVQKRPRYPVCSRPN